MSYPDRWQNNASFMSIKSRGFLLYYGKQTSCLLTLYRLSRITIYNKGNYAIRKTRDIIFDYINSINLWELTQSSILGFNSITISTFVQRKSQWTLEMCILILFQLESDLINVSSSAHTAEQSVTSALLGACTTYQTVTSAHKTYQPLNQWLLLAGHEHI